MWEREKERDRFALIQPLTSICCNTVINDIILIFNGYDCTNEDSKHTHNQPIVHPIIQASFPTNSFSICASIPLKHHGIYFDNCQSLSCKALKVKSNRACRMYTCMYVYIHAIYRHVRITFQFQQTIKIVCLLLTITVILYCGLCVAQFSSNANASHWKNNRNRLTSETWNAAV